MQTEIQLTGMVLSAAPSGEYDRRLVILTRERGKIVAFARGARRQGSRLMAPCNPFAFGTFQVYEGKSAYNLMNAEISSYFETLKADFDGVFYGMYFMEVADYYSRENLEASTLLNLLYVSLRALEKGNLPFPLIKSIFELKAMVLEGEYPFERALHMAEQESTRYAIEYVIQAPLQKLYAFLLKPQIQKEFIQIQDRIRKRMIDREFKSLEILKKTEQQS